MGEVTITVNGRPYRMACEDGQENHLLSLGDDLASRVGDLAGQVGQVGDAQLLVMAALITADELKEMVKASGGDNSAIIAERDALNSDLDALRAAYEGLKQDRGAEAAAEAIAAERDGLASELEALRAAHAALQAERDEQAAAEAAAAAALETLTGRIARLTEALQA